MTRPRRESSSHAVLQIRNNKWKRKKKSEPNKTACCCSAEWANSYVWWHNIEKKKLQFNLTVPVRVNHHHIVPRVFSSALFSVNASPLINLTIFVFSRHARNQMTLISFYSLIYEKRNNLHDKQKRMQIAKFHLDNYVYGHLHVWQCAMCGVESRKIEPQIYFQSNETNGKKINEFSQKQLPMQWRIVCGIVPCQAALIQSTSPAARVQRSRCTVPHTNTNARITFNPIKFDFSGWSDELGKHPPIACSTTINSRTQIPVDGCFPKMEPTRWMHKAQKMAMMLAI